MAIRVTNDFLLDRVVSDINNNLRLLQDIQLKLTTGNKINKPSDDPVGTFQSIQLKKAIAGTEQHQLNIAEGVGRLTATSTALRSIDELMLAVQVLSTESINDTSSVSRGVVANEIDGILNEFFINANAKYLGKYIFGGHESLTPPYEALRDADGNITGVVRNTNGIDDKIFHTIADGLNVEVNVSGSAPFMPNGESGSENIFDTVIRIRDAIAANDLTAASQALGEMEAEFQNIIEQSAVAGARQSTLESNALTNEDLQITKQENLSQILNVDFAAAITDLNFQNFIYESSLNVAARILPQSLLDFI